MFLKLSLWPLEYGNTIKLLFFSVTVEVCDVVPLFLTELEVHFGLELVENSVWVIAPVESCLDMLGFLFQYLLVGANIWGPV